MRDKPLSAKEILDKYSSKLGQRINNYDNFGSDYSREYLIFKKEMAPEFSRYERWCVSLGSMIKLNFSKKDTDKVQKYIDIAHLDIEPWQALNLGVMAFLSIFLFGLFLSVAIALIRGSLYDFPILFF